MRKVFLCALVVVGCMNLSFGQANIKSERITVKTYDEKGLIEQYQLRGTEATSFDIPAFIKENDDLERVTINGTFRTALLTTKIKFDSNQEDRLSGDYICKEVNTDLTPFLGVWGTSKSKELKGVDIQSIIPTTSAEVAGLKEIEDIIAIDDLEINNFATLKKAVLSKQIGDKVELTLKNEDDIYSKYVILGSRGMKTVNYKYCEVEQIEVTEERNLDGNNEESSLTAFPNPTRSFSHVNFKSISKEDIIFSIVDIKGGLIHNQSYSNFKGNLEFDYNLANEVAGTYIFTVQQGKDIYTQKVQLMK